MSAIYAPSTADQAHELRSQVEELTLQIDDFSSALKDAIYWSHEYGDDDEGARSMTLCS